MTAHLFEKLERYLLSEFPTTSEGTWFVKARLGKNPRGALYGAYTDLKDLLRKTGLRQQEREPVNKKPRLTDEQEDSCEMPNEQIEASLEHLKRPVVITDANINQTREFWKSSYTMRRNELEKNGSPQEIFEKYPLYKSSIGPELVRKHFHLKMKQSNLS